jgi:hypothetical protein
VTLTVETTTTRCERMCRKVMGMLQDVNRTWSCTSLTNEFTNDDQDDSARRSRSAVLMGSLIR